MDVEALLVPIREGVPAGPNLRLVDATFDDLNELARELSAEEDVHRRTGKEADWPGILRLASDTLRTRSKDLQLAAWIAVAQLRLDGVAGLCEGIDLIQGLLERFWDSMHPGLDDGALDLEFRGQPLRWLDAMLGGSGARPGALATLPLVQRPEGERALTWRDREFASTVDKYAQDDPARYQALLQEGRVSTEAWTAAVKASSPAQLRGELAGLKRLEGKIAALHEVCVGRFGEGEAPSLLVTSALLSDMTRYLEGLVGPSVPAQAGAAGAPFAAPERAGAGAPAAAAGAIGSRAAAVARLAEVARWFREAEPHSPVSYLVDRAVRWANMPFEELVEDYIKDTSVQGQIWETLGIRRGDG